MSIIQWNSDSNRLVYGGLDRGVLYPRTGPAVPWNGLISVSESKNQQSSKYYVDGKLYLTTVTSSEYSANLSAVTFPEAFSEICGLVEPAPGLFFDADAPDQFGLSYRTHYSDGTNYRINLVYGVTATTSDLNYETFTDSKNDPTPFEFALSAIPQPVYGFRPAAHVVVDTRSLPAEHLAVVEDVIYGTATQDAELPSLQSLYEMMNYNDLVVIRDNGDGTWTAEGAQKHITVNESGEFVIDDITVRDNGDGTYEISSTNEPIV